MPKVICSCPGCRVKLDLVAQALVCKCQKSFCPSHRNSAAHACPVDYTAVAKQDLLKYLSTPIVAKKIDVI